jgi:hypothetical protein
MEHRKETDLGSEMLEVEGNLQKSSALARNNRS